MWIEKIHISGFGIFKDFRLDNLSNGLTVFLGDNEAGKSTFMAFIRQILFGFPRKGLKNRKQYPSLRGGRFGGSLSLHMVNGDILKINRYEGPHGGNLTIFKNDDLQRGSKPLPAVLDGSREDLYRNIFAFSLDELQSLETVDNEKTNTIIYSASMGAGVRSIVEGNKKLDNALEELFKRGGSKPQINQLLQKIEQLEISLAKSQNFLTEYNEKQAELEKKEKDLQNLESELHRLKEKHGENELLLRTHGDWIDQQNAQREISELPDIASFPEDGLLRLNDILKDIEQAEKQIEKLDKKHKELTNEFSEININQNLLKLGSQLQDLIEGKVDYIKAMKDLPERNQELRAREAALNSKFNELGPEWDGNRLLKTDTSLQTREVIRDFQNKLDNSEKNLESIQSEHRQIQKNIQECALKVENAQKSLHEFGDMNLNKSTLRIMPFYISYVLFGLAVASGIVFYILSNITMGLTLTFVFSLFDVLYILLRKKIISSIYQRELQQKNDELQSVQEELNRISRENENMETVLRARKEEYDRILEQWAGWLKDYGLRTNLMPDSVLDIINELKDAKKDLSEIKKLSERITKITATVKEFEEITKKLQKQSGESLPASLDFIDIAGTLYDRLNEQKEMQLQQQALEKSLKNVKNDIEGFKNDLQHAQAKLTKLLEESESDTITDFRQRSENWSRITELKEKIRESVNRIQKAVGIESRLVWLKQHLSEVDKVILERNQHEINDSISNLDSQKELFIRNIAILKNRIEELEQIAETSDLLAEKETLLSEINAKAGEWAVYKIARTLLDQAQTRYEEERQPTIMQEAEKHFAAITGDKYPHVKKPLDGAAMYIADAHEERKSVDGELSRGTTEELYFAVRLGLISNFSKREEPLPVIMDDIFVNMDDKRLPAAIRALKSLTETNQVLVFTCHSKIAELISTEFPDTPIIKLHDGSLA